MPTRKAGVLFVLLFAFVFLLLKFTFHAFVGLFW